MKITLPLPPNRANSRWHWRTENRKKQAYYLSCIGSDVGKRPAQPYDKARISVTLYVWAEMDADNLMARLKWCLDWLKSRGIITDDSPKHLEWAGMPTQVVDRKNRRVEITLSDPEPRT